jgi:hypothetical protein
MPDSVAAVRVVIAGQRLNYALSQAWVPLPPGITALPAAPDPVSDLTYGEVLTPTALLRPYQESTRVDCVVKVQMTQRRLEYSLVLPERIDTLRVKAFGSGSQQVRRELVTISPRIVMPTTSLQFAGGASSVTLTLGGTAAGTVRTPGEGESSAVLTLNGTATGSVLVNGASAVTLAITGSASGGIAATPISATYTQRSVYSSNAAATESGMANGVFSETTQTGTDSHTTGDLAWVQMDFGSVTSFGRVHVGSGTEALAGGWGRSYTENADIIGSNDLSSWTVLANTGTFAVDGIQSYSTPGASYRYVRMRRSGFLAVTEFYATA